MTVEDIAKLVNDELKAGRIPYEIVMNPLTFWKLKDPLTGKDWRLLMIAGVPVSIDPDIDNVVIKSRRGSSISR